MLSPVGSNLLLLLPAQAIGQIYIHAAKPSAKMAAVALRERGWRPVHIRELAAERLRQQCPATVDIDS